jgi:hypothetical protein
VKLSRNRIGEVLGLHRLHSYSGQPPVHGIRGQKAADHGDLHHEPELNRVGVQLYAEAMAEDLQVALG